MIRGVLFDLDGTLLDHRAAADAAIADWLAARFPGHPRLAEAPALRAALEGPCPRITTPAALPALVAALR